MSQAQATKATATIAPEQMQEREAISIGYQAYIQGFVYVKTMLLQREALNPSYRFYAPINSLYVQDALAKPGMTDSTPNSDTLYGFGWLDLTQGPILITVPKIENRYWTMQATDYALQTLDYIGSRVGSKPGVYAYARADWKGELPAGVQRIDSQTGIIWLQLRTLVDPAIKGDLEAVVKINRSFSFTPLNKVAKYATSASSSDESMSPKNTNPSLHNLEFFTLFNQAWTKNTLRADEIPMVTQYGKLGIGENLKFDAKALTEAQRRGLQEGIDAAVADMFACFNSRDGMVNGWIFRTALGSYDNYNYELRATTAYYGYGANRAVEALYLNNITDKNGDFFSGKNSYRLHFDKDNLPPAEAFWSMTMYTFPENQLVDNPINRYNVSSLTPELKYNSDGSLDVYIGNKRPEGGKASNWLPSPTGQFWMVLRLYSPKEIAAQGKYIPPPVERQ